MDGSETNQMTNVATCRRNRWRIVLWATILHPLPLWCSSAMADLARQEEIFRSIQSSARGETDRGNSGIILLMMVVAISLLFFVVNLRRRAQEGSAGSSYSGGSVTRTVNHNGKLLREIRKQIGLQPAELKQLKLLSESLATSDRPAPSPLTLLLCPSVFAKAVEKSRGSKVDRAVIEGLAKRLQAVAVEAA